jgi:hypothetical protein
MGLDWVLKARAVEGQEAEFSRLRDESLRIDGILSDKWREWLAAQEDKDSVKDYQAFLAAYPDLWDELVRVRAAKDKVTLSHYAVLDCPRIGIDPEATEWARQFYSDVFARRPNAPTLEAFLAEEHGKYVPDLAKNPEGLGKVTGIGAGPESFRGKIIGYADAVIGEQLAHRAYQDMDPDEMEDYADELEAAVEGWRNENEEKINRYMDLIGRLETDHKADSDVGEALDICDDVANAVTWLRFWAGHGFSMHAWY